MADRRYLLLGVALGVLAPLAARAQQYTRPHHETLPTVDRNQPITFTADRVDYDRNTGLVTASGHVEAWQNDHVLRADAITYDRNTNVLAATGHVAMVEPDGEVLFSDYAEVTQGMRDGILKNMRAILADNGRLAANGARRTDGDLTEMAHVVYSTCNLCKEDPTQAPLWQISAASAIWNKDDKKIEYRDMVLDMFGVPVGYFPWFSHADPSVRRASGFLIPDVGNSSHLGTFFALPYYYVINQSSDIQFRPLVGSLGLGDLDTDYRQRFNNGRLNINVSVGYDRATAATSSLGATQGGMQASVFAKGNFNYDDTWRYGFDLQYTSSVDYLRDFNLPNDQDILTSQIFVEGFGAGSYSKLDFRGYQTLTEQYNQNYLPYVLPHYEYSFVGEPDPLGGRLSVDAGAFNVYRVDGTRTQRASLSGDYVRPFTDDIGGLYNVTVHVDSAVYNAQDLNRLPNFSSEDEATTGRIQPQLALNWRMPFVRPDDDYGNTLIEPIVQLIGAPNTGTSGDKNVPNEDSDDFEFSDANLFAFNRHGGIDRLEGGERINYGLHSNWTLDNQQIDMLVGESYRFHKDDTYLWGSGLENRLSDIVGRVTYSPASWFDTTLRTRLDPHDFRVHMADASFTVGPKLLQLNGGYMYENINPYALYDTSELAALSGVSFPIAGANNQVIPVNYFTPRNEATLGLSTQFTNYKISAYMRRDLQLGEFVDVGAKASYEDECFIVAANFDKRYTSIDGDNGNTMLLLEVTFKTVGQVGYHAF